MRENDLILAENQYYDLDSYKTKLNNNVLVVGTSGSGKTRHIVTPNLLQAVGSYIVSDPKGNLHRKYKSYLEDKGYVVKKVDFIHPKQSVGYNPLSYIKNEQDILKLARVFADMGGRFKSDPFWDQMTEVLLTALISFVRETCKWEDRNLTTVQKIIQCADIDENNGSRKNKLDLMMDELDKKNAGSFAVRQYEKFRIGASKTLKSILITANAKMGTLDTEGLRRMLKQDEIDFSSIGKRKTAVFVVVSDTDRSMDTLANVFFSQAMTELCRYADDYCSADDNRLPVPVRFILDDFATNVQILEFPRMIASIRSRGISTMLMIQAEGQLTKAYQDDDKTIIGNCDSYIYLGGNDIDTAEAVARRCDLPLKKILNMEVGTCWIFRRGQEPVNAKLFDLSRYEQMREEHER